jgi:hypothetical protein
MDTDMLHILESNGLKNNHIVAALCLENIRHISEFMEKGFEACKRFEANRNHQKSLFTEGANNRYDVWTVTQVEQKKLETILHRMKDERDDEREDELRLWKHGSTQRLEALLTQLKTLK